MELFAGLLLSAQLRLRLLSTQRSRRGGGRTDSSTKQTGITTGNRFVPAKRMHSMWVAVCIIPAMGYGLHYTSTWGTACFIPTYGLRSALYQHMGHGLHYTSLWAVVCILPAYAGCKYVNMPLGCNMTQSWRYPCGSCGQQP